MVKCTSAEAGKILKKLNEELNAVLAMETQSKEFLASLGEDPESVRPEYNYSETNRKIDDLEEKIRILKHTVNQFNISTIVPKIGLTIDQTLILIPQLTSRCFKLRDMMSKLPKTRDNSSKYGSSSIIDYRYINYDLKQVEADFYECKQKLDTAQLQLDQVNSTLAIELDDMFAPYLY